MMTRQRLRRWGPLIAYVILALAVAFAVGRVFDVAHRADQVSKETRTLAIRVAREAQARVNESCVQSEARYENAVEQLSSTYDYITALPPDERGQTLNKFIIKNIPKTEQDVKDAKPPAFCDEPGIGQPEPNPVVPERPPLVNRLVNGQG